MKKLILGIILCAAAFIVPLTLVIPMISALANGTVEFEAPGELEVTVEEPGRHYVYHEYVIVFKGRSYSRDKGLPDGVTFSLTGAESGESFPMQTDSSFSFSTGERQNVSVGYFEVEQPGDYILRIGGLDEPRIFSFGPALFENFASFFVQLIVGFMLVIATMIAGILLIVFGIIALVRQSNNPTGTPR